MEIGRHCVVSLISMEPNGATLRMLIGRYSMTVFIIKMAVTMKMKRERVRLFPIVERKRFQSLKWIDFQSNYWRKSHCFIDYVENAKYRVNALKITKWDCNICTLANNQIPSNS